MVAQSVGGVVGEDVVRGTLLAVAVILLLHAGANDDDGSEETKADIPGSGCWQVLAEGALTGACGCSGARAWL